MDRKVEVLRAIHEKDKVSKWEGSTLSGAASGFTDEIKRSLAQLNQNHGSGTRNRAIIDGLVPWFDASGMANVLRLNALDASRPKDTNLVDSGAECNVFNDMRKCVSRITDTDTAVTFTNAFDTMHIEGIGTVREWYYDGCGHVYVRAVKLGLAHPTVVGLRGGAPSIFSAGGRDNIVLNAH